RRRDRVRAPTTNPPPRRVKPPCSQNGRIHSAAKDQSLFVKNRIRKSHKQQITQFEIFPDRHPAYSCPLGCAMSPSARPVLSPLPRSQSEWAKSREARTGAARHSSARVIVPRSGRVQNFLLQPD